MVPTFWSKAKASCRSYRGEKGGESGVRLRFAAVRQSVGLKYITSGGSFKASESACLTDIMQDEVVFRELQVGLEKALKKPSTPRENTKGKSVW